MVKVFILMQTETSMSESLRMAKRVEKECSLGLMDPNTSESFNTVNRLDKLYYKYLLKA